MLILIIFILGLIVGSFLNVCIYRLPRNESIIRPPSHCPSCNKSIVWHDNIPILSFVALKGRCRNCKGRISLRYPLVELLTGVVSIILFIEFGFCAVFLVYAALSFGLIVATFIDLEHRFIPDEITYGGLVIGILASLIWPRLHNTTATGSSLINSFSGILTGGGLIWLSGAAGKFLFKKEAMGGGDLKLMAMMGAFIGWQKILIAFFLAPFLGIFFAVYTLIKHKDHYIAYGPFLALAGFLVILYGDSIIRFFSF